MATGITIPTRDKYDEAVEYLKANPDRIGAAWSLPSSTQGGCLFKYANGIHGEADTGCLTMIRDEASLHVPGRPDLTQEIRNDPRIPEHKRLITVSDLPIFAEWQRRLDVELGRK